MFSRENAAGTLSHPRFLAPSTQLNGPFQRAAGACGSIYLRALYGGEKTKKTLAVQKLYLFYYTFKKRAAENRAKHNSNPKLPLVRGEPFSLGPLRLAYGSGKGVGWPASNATKLS
jgi:hypothetical protein